MNDANFWQSVAATPWWVFVLASYTFYGCYFATKPRELPIKVLYLLPVSIISMTCMTIGALPNEVNFNNFMIWVDMVLLGTGLSYLHAQFVQVKAIKDTFIIAIPGTYIPFGVLIIAIISKVYFGINFSLKQNFFFDKDHLSFLLTSYGFTTGIFIGRLGYALRCLKERGYS